jgi:hypothetical protein
LASPPPTPVHPEEAASITDFQHPRGLPSVRQGIFGNLRPASEPRNVLASADSERNIQQGLQGNRADLIGNAREAARPIIDKSQQAGLTLVKDPRTGAVTGSGLVNVELPDRPGATLSIPVTRFNQMNPADLRAYVHQELSKKGSMPSPEDIRKYMGLQ